MLLGEKSAAYDGKVYSLFSGNVDDSWKLRLLYVRLHLEVAVHPFGSAHRRGEGLCGLDITVGFFSLKRDCLL